MASGPFGNCKEAQLHQILELQSYGALIAIDKRSHLISACTSNVQDFTGKTPQELLGQPWSGILHPNMVDSMFSADSGPRSNVCRVITAELNGTLFEISNHTVGDFTLVELEPSQEANKTINFSHRAAFISELSQLDDSAETAKFLMKEVSSIIDFDRVMLYRFLPGWHGEVIAENLKPGIEGFMGLRFPEGDVPANARRLFTVNLQRLIADASATTTPIERLNESVQLDLTFSQLRAIHPVHIKYLENMGVYASFSLSIICQGKLWGLIACHHLSPKVLSISERQQCEELTRIAAMHMNDNMRADLERKRYAYRVAISEIRGSLNAQRKGFQTINAHIAEFKNLFHGNGIWHHIGGEDYFSGNVPDQTSLSLLRNWAARLDRNIVSAHYQIPPELASQPALVRFASGTLHIPLNKSDFILVMRQEQVENVTWAGKPQSIDNAEDSIAILTPRSSFQKWSQELKGQCDPWHELDLESAERLREELIDYLDRSEIEEMALKDPLTGLANRLYFERHLNESIRDSINSDNMFAVYMIDLDNFKPVNDTLGHAAGDELLIQVGQRLTALLREDDIAARLGGDEFAIILNKVHSNKDVDQIADRILAEIKRPFSVENKQVQIGASIGVSLCPLDASSQAELMREADVALYEVKKSGRNGFKRFEMSMLSDQEFMENTRAMLEMAFEKNQFEFYFQPVIDSRSNALNSLEAFCVWNHPEEGLISASDFQALIEKHQFTAQWAEWGLQALFKLHQHLNRSGFDSVPLCLNLSAKQFINVDIVGICIDLTKKYEIDASWLRLDLDENTLVVSTRRAEEKILQLNKIGVLVNIDHFGQGLVSLRQLTQLKINSLKVDGTLLNSSKSNKEIEAQIAIFNSISNVIKVPLVATKIEDLHGINVAREYGITSFQGYAISKPMNQEDTIKWIQDPKKNTQHLY